MGEHTDILIQRRMDAYIEMLKASYQVDEYGLADMLGIDHRTWTRGHNKGYKDYSAKMVFALVNLTGISADWLLLTSEELTA